MEMLAEIRISYNQKFRNNYSYARASMGSLCAALNAG
jgi:hypothetical protein